MWKNIAGNHGKIVAINTYCTLVTLSSCGFIFLRFKGNINSVDLVVKK